MSVTETSREAYESVDLTERQAEVLEAGQHLVRFTDLDLAAHLGWPINRITPRRGELVDQGYFVECGKVQGPTGRRCSLWTLRPRQADLFASAA
jgi:hypothetical protein